MDLERRVEKKTTTTTTTTKQTLFQVEDNDVNAYNTQYDPQFTQDPPVHHQPYPVPPLSGPSYEPNYGSRTSLRTNRPKTARQAKKEREAGRVDSEDETCGTLAQYLCSTSSAHGLSRAAESKNIFRTVIWSILFVGSLSAYVLQTYYLISDYAAWPIDVRTEIVTKKNVVFPAITICNMNQMRRSELSNSSYSTLTVLDMTADELAAARNSSAASSASAFIEFRKKRALVRGEKPAVYTPDELLRLHAKIRFLTMFGGRKKKLEDFGVKGIWVPKRKKVRIADPEEFENKDKLIKGKRKKAGGNKEGKRLKRRKKKPVEERTPEEEEAMKQEQEDYYGESLVRNKRADDYYNYYYDDDYDYYGNNDDPLGNNYNNYNDPSGNKNGTGGSNYYYYYEEYYPDATFADYIEDELDIDMGTLDTYYDMDTYDLGFVDYSYLKNITSDHAYDQLLRVSQTSDYSDVMDTLRPTREELRNFGHQKKDMVIQCSFDKNTCTAKEFKRINNAKYGNCYSFNVEQEGKQIKKTSRFGSQYGLRLTLNVEADEYVGMYAPETGVRVVIHPYDATPFPEDQGISAPTGKATSIGIRKRRVSRLGLPWGECTDGTDPNIKLEYRGTYSVTGCMTSCVQSSLRETCGCVDLILSEKSTQTRCSVSNYTQVQCRAKVYLLHSLNQLVCYCPDQCEEEWFETTISQSDWPSKRYSPMMIARMNEFDYGQKLLDNLSPEYITKNFARLHLYFQELNFHQIVELPGYTGSRLLSDLGGTAGLYMGMSFLTMVEFVEMVLIMSQWIGRRLCFPIRKRKVSPRPLRP